MGATATAEKPAKATTPGGTSDDGGQTAPYGQAKGKGCKAACPATAKTRRQAACRKEGGREPAGKRNAALGRKGEDAAARYLEQRGYEIVERNWTCVAGEADIIARDAEWLVFVEVKTRRNTERGFPSEAVNERKRERYERIALAYAAAHAYTEVPVRFDVVSIVVIGKDKAMIRHHMNAFTR